MNFEDLKKLGFDEQDIKERVVESIADRIMNGKDFDYDQEDWDASETNFAKSVKALVQERIDQAVEKVAEKHTLPNITEYLENLCIQKTNSWGEKKGEPTTFIEYLTHRAETYLTEKVDHNGESRKTGSTGWGGWKENGTRVSYLVDRHLQYSVSTAIKKGLNDINGQIAEGLDGVVKIQLQQALEGIKINTTIK